MRTDFRRAIIAVAAVALSAPLVAQDSTAAKPTTHTVAKGDNLWNLSQRYLGNPFLWTELYRLNRDVVEDPHWIYPGEVLRLPGAEVAQVPDSQSQPVTPPVKPVPADSTPAPVEVAQPMQPRVQPPTDPGLQTERFPRVTSAGSSAPTTSGSALGELAPPLPPTVRSGEAIVAPFVDREGGPRSYGRIVKSGDLAGIGQASERFRFQAYDRVMIEPPVGQVAPEGERYLAYRLGPIIENMGQVMIPTGVVEVIEAPRAGAPAVAKVVKAFNELSASDRLILLDTSGTGITTRPRRVTGGPSTTVRWVYGEPVLPSLQNYVVLGVTSRNGVRVGDEYVIYRPRPKAEEGIPTDPAVPAGKVQVVRSTPFGVTAIIIGQEQPSISEGMPARVIARMP
jgi:hypothetical protein